MAQPWGNCARLKNNWRYAIDVKTYDGDDKVRLKSANKFTIPTAAEEQGGVLVYCKDPGTRIWIKCEGYAWKVDVNSTTQIPPVPHFSRLARPTL
jgi:hypothetical protein